MFADEEKKPRIFTDKDPVLRTDAEKLVEGVLPFEDNYSQPDPKPVIPPVPEKPKNFDADINDYEQKYKKELEDYKKRLLALPNAAAISGDVSKLLSQFRTIAQIEAELSNTEKYIQGFIIWVGSPLLTSSNSANVQRSTNLEIQFSSAISSLRDFILAKRKEAFPEFVLYSYNNDTKFSSIATDLIKYSAQTPPTFTKTDLDGIENRMSEITGYLCNKIGPEPHPEWQVELIRNRYLKNFLETLTQLRAKLKDHEVAASNVDQTKSLEKSKERFEALYRELTIAQSFEYMGTNNDLKKYYDQFAALLQNFRDSKMNIRDIAQYKERSTDLLINKIVYFVFKQKYLFIIEGRTWPQEFDDKVVSLMGEILGQNVGHGIKTLEGSVGRDATFQEIHRYFIKLDGRKRNDTDVEKIVAYFNLMKVITHDKYVNLSWGTHADTVVGGSPDGVIRNYPVPTEKNFDVKNVLDGFINDTFSYGEYNINMELRPRVVVGENGLGFDKATGHFYTVAQPKREGYTAFNPDTAPNKIEFTETARGWLLRWFSRWAKGWKEGEVPGITTKNFHQTTFDVLVAAMEELHVKFPKTKEKIRIEDVANTFRWWVLVSYHQSVYATSSAEGSDIPFYLKNAILYFMQYYAEDLAHWNARLFLKMHGTNFLDYTNPSQNTSDVLAGQLPPGQRPSGNVFSGLRRMIDPLDKVEAAKNALRKNEDGLLIKDKPKKDRHYYSKLMAKRKSGKELTRIEQTWLDCYVEYGFGDYAFLFEPLFIADVYGDNIEMSFKSPLASLYPSDFKNDPSGKTPLRYLDENGEPAYIVSIEDIRSQGYYVEIPGKRNAQGQPLVQYIPPEIIWEVAFKGGVNYPTKLASTIGNLSGNVTWLLNFYKTPNFYAKLMDETGVTDWLNELKNKVRYCLPNLPGEAFAYATGLMQKKDPAAQFYKTEDMLLHKYIVKFIHDVIQDKVANDISKGKKSVNWTEVKNLLKSLVGGVGLTARDGAAIYTALTAAYGTATSIDHWISEFEKAAEANMLRNPVK